MRKRNVSHFLTKPRGRLENTNTNMTLSMPRESAARLRRLAEERGMDLHGLIEVAVEEWLAREHATPKAPAPEVSPPPENSLPDQPSGVSAALGKLRGLFSRH